MYKAMMNTCKQIYTYTRVSKDLYLWFLWDDLNTCTSTEVAHDIYISILWAWNLITISINDDMKPIPMYWCDTHSHHKLNKYCQHNTQCMMKINNYKHAQWLATKNWLKFKHKVKSSISLHLTLTYLLLLSKRLIGQILSLFLIFIFSKTINNK